MAFDHERLDVYRVSLQFVAWSYRLSGALRGLDRHARDQLLRASQSIPLNIAEGNGKRPGPDRRRFWHIAYGSTLACAAVLDVLAACNSIAPADAAEGKQILHRIVGMLARMTAVGETVREENAEYSGGGEEME